LIAATANAADLVRDEDRGRIKEGAIADLLVVDGNPVSDIAMAARAENHRMVVKNGVRVA
jgi:imidazolonepropionase-like amidohydrolase